MKEGLGDALELGFAIEYMLISQRIKRYAYRIVYELEYLIHPIDIALLYYASKHNKSFLFLQK